MNEHHGNTRHTPAEVLKAMLGNKEDWLMERILAYAIQQGYSAYTSTLKEAWRSSISGLSTSIVNGLHHLGGYNFIEKCYCRGKETKRASAYLLLL